MLCYPSDSTVRTTSIVGIDPGSETLGLSIIEFDIETLIITRSTAKTFTGSKMFEQDNWMSCMHGARTARIHAHKKNLIEQFSSIDPVAIACESPFYNPRRPNAYGVLVETLSMIRQAVMEYDPWKWLYLIDPPTVKKSVGAAGNADKEKMFVALSNLTELKLDKPIETYDEHSIDAIAVAYCRLKQMREFVNPK